ncbi:DMT family transporter (plasmid) [Arsenophonus nasoniae]|nr:DMT family transporter [Arsenophonus nasoniae]QBY46456.1 Riboflavin transporter [Arsenophonus nasoniae]WGM08600.1 DMT family transporter [Arsenophonus nasoniae]WGM13347.1 DMT family transporter [Arsenophonus nasoniae]WGM18004.1 DMT family transporter [Arsenophonus nasoniae]
MNQGALLAIFASLIFSVMNTLVKIIADDIPTGEIVFFRSSIGCLLVLLLMYRYGVVFSREDRPLLVLRGAMGGLYLICYFYSIANLTLADASMLVYLSPFFSILLSLLVMRERINANALFWLVMVIIGAILLVRPWDFSAYTLASLVGVLSAVFAAIAYLSVNKLSKRHHNYEIVFYFLFIATLLSLPLMWNSFIWPNAYQFAILLSIALVSLLGQVVLTQAFYSENLIVVSVVRYIGIVFNIGWGWLFWNEIPMQLSIFGSLLVVVSCIQLGLLNRNKAV